MAKETTPARYYNIVNACIVGAVCGTLALLVGYLIHAGTIKHEFSILFPYAVVGIMISLLNFKPLSKLAIILLPPESLMGFMGTCSCLVVGSRSGMTRSCFRILKSIRSGIKTSLKRSSVRAGILGDLLRTYWS